MPGDGIGPEIVVPAVEVLKVAASIVGLGIKIEEGHIGGAALKASGKPLSEDILVRAQAADAVLLGAVGGPQWDGLDPHLRPERGLLGLRAGLGVFANLRPVRAYRELIGASTLRAEVIDGLDLVIVRELTGDLYFGEPRGFRRLPNGEQQAFNTMVYSEGEVRRIARFGFKLAAERRGLLCSVDKANVLEATQLWRRVVGEVARDYPKVAVTHLYVDNAAMQLVRQPKQVDVMLTPNLFGDILSDLASTLTGSIGMLPSASLNETSKGLYEPIHGSAPDIAGRNLANPLATILSVAMMLRYSLGAPAAALKIEAAVMEVLKKGLRTADIGSAGDVTVGTQEMGREVLRALLANRDELPR